MLNLGSTQEERNSRATSKASWKNISKMKTSNPLGKTSKPSISRSRRRTLTEGTLAKRRKPSTMLCLLKRLTETK